MPKKYIQLLLSINFCLTAAATATDSDADSIGVLPHQGSSFELSDQFYHIWHRLKKIDEIYPSELLQEALLQHQKKLENPTVYDESKPQQDLTHNIPTQFIAFYNNLGEFSKYQFKEEPDEDIQVALKMQFEEIRKCIDRVHKLYKEQSLSKNDQFSLYHQLEELTELLFLYQGFLAKDLSSLYNTTPANELSNTDSAPKLLPGEFSPVIMELNNLFNQIWKCLDEVNTIHESEPLQKLISHHGNTEILYNENLEEVSREILENQFTQLDNFLGVSSQHQPEEELDKESRAKLGTQFDRIKGCLSAIREIYDSKKESLSKKEKAFLSNQLQEFCYFSYNFRIENSLQLEDLNRFSYDSTIVPPPLQTPEDELHSLDSIQALLDSCEEEDSLIYPQYEYIINSQKANIAKLLTSSKTGGVIENQFLYFNKAEGLIEIQHTELSEEGKDIKPYTTTWKIRPADTSLVVDWKEQDPIAISEAAFYEKYTMRGEKLNYNLTNRKKSVRANFVCKSSKKNTYTILSIDYLESVVILRNGPCLFVQGEDLKEWHAGDSVVLQRSELATNTDNPHKLINKTRGSKRVQVLLKKKS